MGGTLIRQDSCPYKKKRYKDAHTGKRSREGTARRWPSANHEGKTKPADSSISDSQLPDGEKIDSCLLSHSACGLWLWESQPAKARRNKRW